RNCDRRFCRHAPQQSRGVQSPPDGRVHMGNGFVVVSGQHIVLRIDPMEKLLSLTDRTALITGAGTGIGAAAAEALAAAGAGLVLVGRDLSKLKAQRERILESSAPPFIDCISCDVSRTASVNSLAREVLAKRTVDILVNNAG